MSINFFRKKETAIPKEKNTDSFADSLSLEFKRLAIEEILNQLHLAEGKYLSSILKSSYFPIELIIFHPLDNSTALETEEFFRIHSEISPNFEDSFFSNLLLKEYQTNHGAKALLQATCPISIQPDINSLDDPTLEEAYQISLRGNRKRFSVTVKLGALKANEIPRIPVEVSPKSNLHNFGRPVNAPNASKGPSGDMQLAIQITDGKGESQLLSPIPLVIGRESSDPLMNGITKSTVSAMYISRNQLNIFALNNKVYAFIPEDAKLTGIHGDNQILEKMHLYEITDKGLNITFGQPFDTETVIVEANTPKLYPTVSIKLTKHTAKALPDSTPIPNVKE